MGSKTTSHSSATGSSRTHSHRQHKSAVKLLLVLHSFNLLLALSSISLLSAIVPVWDANFFHGSGLVRGDWPDALLILPLALTLLTSACYLFRLFRDRRTASRAGDYLRSRHSSHTGSKISKKPLFLTLTILILLLAFIALSATSGLYRFWRPAVITSSIELSSGAPSSSLTLSSLSLRHVSRSISDNNPTSPGLTPPKSNPSAQNSKLNFHSCTLANVFTRGCNPTLFLLGDLQITAISTSSLAWLLNLIILVLQIREHQQQKRRLQRSLRAKARSKLDLIEDEMSRAEKGGSSSSKKIHHEKRRGHSKSPSAPLPPSTQMAHVTRPVRAHTLSNVKEEVDDGSIRPKQHYYDPNITPSRLRCPPEPGKHSSSTVYNVKPLFVDSHVKHPKQDANSVVQNPGHTAYSKAVDEARQRVKPGETMREWLATQR